MSDFPLVKTAQAQHSSCVRFTFDAAASTTRYPSRHSKDSQVLSQQTSADQPVLLLYKALAWPKTQHPRWKTGKKKSGMIGSPSDFRKNEPKDHEPGSPHIFTLSILKPKNNWGASRGIPAMLKLGLISRRALKVLTCPLTTLLIAAPREFTLRMSWHPSLRHESLALFDSVRMDSPCLVKQAVLVEKHQWNTEKTLETNREWQ